MNRNDLSSSFEVKIPLQVCLRNSYKVRSSENSLVISSLCDEIEVLPGNQNSLHAINRVFNEGYINSSELDLNEFVIDMFSKGILVSENSGDGLNVISEIEWTIKNEIPKLGLPFEFLDNLFVGKAPKHQVIGWLLEMFIFTLNAKMHISPVIKKATNSSEEHFWQLLCDDEGTHWRMYTKIFKEIGVNIESIVNLKPLPFTEEFVDLLHKLAGISQYHYAAALKLIELGPDCESLDEDTCFSALFNYYGFSRSAVLPLWEHTVYNHKSGHSDIGTFVLGSKNDFRDDEVCEFIQIPKDLRKALSKLYKGIEDYYTDFSKIEERLSGVKIIR